MIFSFIYLCNIINDLRNQADVYSRTHTPGGGNWRDDND